MKKKVILLSDLDNTLIFSYKKLSAENVCVEKKDGKELSYMTPLSAEMFAEIVKRVTFIPVTTRSAEQYGRIIFPGEYIPEYAVIDNGANLLVNGQTDREWQRSFAGIYAECAEEIARCCSYLEKCANVYFEIRIVDGSFLFTKCRDCENIIADMRKNICPEKTELFSNGDKLYAIPAGISKENAAVKLRERLGDVLVIAAGDSLFDVGMLKAADIPIAAGELAPDLSAGDPDYVLKQVLGILEREEI